MNTLELKRGDTLDLLCTVQQDGQPLDITGWQIDCWVSAQGRVVHRFAGLVVDAAAGQYALRATPADTAQWPLGGLSADIRYTDSGGRVMTTRTFPVRVEERITAGAAP